MKLGIIIQARTGSTRLPSKVLLPFYREKSILDILLEKLKVFKEKYPIILATSTNNEDLILKKYANKYRIHYFRGSETNVLDRFIDATTKFNLNTVVRICSDNPFLDIESIYKIVGIYKNLPEIDYCSFKNSSGIPVIKTHIGLFAEIISLKALNRVKELTSNKLYTEHVTNYLYSHPDLFEIYLENSRTEVYNRNDLRFTVDDEQDFEYLSQIYEIYKENNLDLNEIIEFVDNNVQIKNKMKENIIKYSK